MAGVKMPASGTTHPARRHPAMSRTRRNPLPAGPDIPAPDPAPVTTHPDIARGRRHTHDLSHRCWRLIGGHHDRSTGRVYDHRRRRRRRYGCRRGGRSHDHGARYGCHHHRPSRRCDDAGRQAIGSGQHKQQPRNLNVLHWRAFPIRIKGRPQCTATQTTYTVLPDVTPVLPQKPHGR